jgi:hypothetical protein
MLWVCTGDAGLKQRTWTCPACGITKERDLSAGVNLKTWGQVLPLLPVEEKAVACARVSRETDPARRESSTKVNHGWLCTSLEEQLYTANIRPISPVVRNVQCPMHASLRRARAPQGKQLLQTRRYAAGCAVVDPERGIAALRQHVMQLEEFDDAFTAIRKSLVETRRHHVDLRAWPACRRPATRPTSRPAPAPRLPAAR